MRISVIIPTYRPKSYLWDCLDALASQTFPKDSYDVWIILNGCKEPYQHDIENYIYNHYGCQWHFVQVNKAGVSDARNYGINNSEGEYIAFIDDDDVVSPTYLERLYNCASEDTISVCRPVAFNDGEIEKELSYEMSDVFRVNEGKKKVDFIVTRKFYGGPCMKLIHRSIISNRRFDPKFKNGEDSLFMFLISDKVKYTSFTSNDAIYYRRIRENSAVTKKRSLTEKIGNAFKLMMEETKIYFGGFPRYRFSFYITRLLGAVRGVLVG